MNEIEKTTISLERVEGGFALPETPVYPNNIERKADDSVGKTLETATNNGQVFGSDTPKVRDVVNSNPVSSHYPIATSEQESFNDGDIWSAALALGPQGMPL